MSIATWLRRLTALVVVLALGAPAWTVCRTVASGDPMAGMPCCHDDGATASGTVGGDCCTVQPEDPADSPLTPAAPTVRVSSPGVIVVDLLAAPAAANASHDRRAEADSRARPHTAPHLLDSVLLI